MLMIDRPYQDLSKCAVVLCVLPFFCAGKLKVHVCVCRDQVASIFSVGPFQSDYDSLIHTVRIVSDCTDVPAHDACLQGLKQWSRVERLELSGVSGRTSDTDRLNSEFWDIRRSRYTYTHDFRSTNGLLVKSAVSGTKVTSSKL